MRKRVRHQEAARFLLPAGVLLACLLLAGCSRDVLTESKENRLYTVESGETIHVRIAGHGPRPVILLAGNNCSGASFQPMLRLVNASAEIAEKYTFYAFDYRGSGESSYVHPIETLDDFARDFDDVVQQDPMLSDGGITLVGHSMGFGVAQLMVDRDPAKYRTIVSLAGIGTRGVRVLFAGGTVGVDPQTGKSYRLGDWADSLEAVIFHQRAWIGENRTRENVESVWNAIVFNEILRYGLATAAPTDTTYFDDPGYGEAIDDVLQISYMPESLLASHRFNASPYDLEHTNQDGTFISIPGSGRIEGFAGKRVLLVKARTSRASWRGDLVIDDSITQNTKYDLREAGADVTAILIDAGQGFDHGFPFHHPEETLRLIAAFSSADAKERDESAYSEILGTSSYALYGNEERDWERSAYGGF